MITRYGSVTVDEERTIITGFAFDGYTSYREIIEWAISRMKANLAMHEKRAKTDPLPEDER